MLYIRNLLMVNLTKKSPRCNWNVIRCTSGTSNVSDSMDARKESNVKGLVLARGKINESELFQGVTDRFNGLTVDTSTEYNEADNFRDKLQKSLDMWTASGKRGIWFKVHTNHASAIPELIKNGFDFHHAKTGYVMLFKWLPTDEKSNIPSYPHNFVGVGGLVVNDKDEILVVSDKYTLIPNSWKLPGGYVDPRENLVDAVIREVREETTVESQFTTLVSVRHAHGGNFGCSDLYFVLALKPKTLEIKPCKREIAKVKWMPIRQYLNDPNVHESTRDFAQYFLRYREYNVKFDYTSAVHRILRRPYIMYYLDKNSQGI